MKSKLLNRPAKWVHIGLYGMLILTVAALWIKELVDAQVAGAEGFKFVTVYAMVPLGIYIVFTAIQAAVFRCGKGFEPPKFAALSFLSVAKAVVVFVTEFMVDGFWNVSFVRESYYFRSVCIILFLTAVIVAAAVEMLTLFQLRSKAKKLQS